MDMTVVIPTLNRRDMLEDTLRGLMSQTVSPERFEVIVVDGGSEDGTRDMIEELAAIAPMQIRYTEIPGKNQGPAPKRNRGARMAQGSILAFTDSDCRPDPGWLQAGAEAMGDGVSIVQGTVLFKPEQDFGEFPRQSQPSFGHPTVPTANVFYRREVFSEYGGFDESLCFLDPLGRATEVADTDLAWRIKKSGRGVVYAPNAIVYHEKESMSLGRWLVEPTRLFPLAALLRAHPELRRELLIANIVFYRGTIAVYLTVPLIVLAVIWTPWVLTAPAVPLMVRSLQASKGSNWTAVGKYLAFAPLHFVRMVILAATLVGGSVRYRSLVL
jgi:glycosyltransferase involved in cell wall biosynthesis